MKMLMASLLLPHAKLTTTVVLVSIFGLVMIAAHAASDVIADVVKDAVANLIKEAPQELTGECNVWKNYADFPVGKL